MKIKENVNLAVVLAGGQGIRLNNKFGDIPKGFIAFGERSLIERSCSLLFEAGIERILIGTGYSSSYYEKYSNGKNIRCIKNHNYKNTSSFFTLINMKNAVNESFVLLESDIYYERRAVTDVLNSVHENVILVSGNTNSGDEVYVETDSGSNLVNLSKIKNELSNVHGELVGVSKISYETFLELCNWSENNLQSTDQIDYEKALVEISNKIKIHVEKIEDLIWCEIDNEDHYNRAKNIIHPLILKKEDKSYD